MQPTQRTPRHGTAPAGPVLAVPATAWPGTVIDHNELVDVVRDQYDKALAAADAPIETQLQLTLAIRMCRNLAIDHHTSALPLATVVRPRGFAERNSQATEIFRTLTPAAAERAMANAKVGPSDIDAVIVACSTVVAMPSPAVILAELLGLPPACEIIPLYGLGCLGGAHAIARAFEYVTARPDRTVLVVAAEAASPLFYVETDRRGRDLIGSLVAQAMFSDGAAAAVVGHRPDVPGYELVDTTAITLPGTRGALSYTVEDDGPHLRLTDNALRITPEIIPPLQALIDAQGWEVGQLAPAACHTGGNRIIDAVQAGLKLDDSQLAATRNSLRRRGNAMSAAVLDVLADIATDPQHRPAHGTPGLAAGYGPGFGAVGIAWRFHDSGAIQSAA